MLCNSIQQFGRFEFSFDRSEEIQIELSLEAGDQNSGYEFI